MGIWMMVVVVVMSPEDWDWACDEHVKSFVLGDTIL